MSGNRERMRKALENRPPRPPAKPAAAAKKSNPRTAAARDARARARGRLPNNVMVGLSHDDGLWHATFTINTTGEMFYQVKKSADGLFRLLEEIDVEFWNWFAAKGSEDEEYLKSRFVWSESDVKPEPYPKENK